uniref:Uncharacterized protein n=1 Tax=Panagrolaimus davidi TaxID=227884 RepID=A0A914QLH8_9BILA
MAPASTDEVNVSSAVPQQLPVISSTLIPSPVRNIVNTQQIRHIQSSTSISTPQNYGSQISQQQQNISTSLTTTTTARGQVERHVLQNQRQV